MSAGHCVRRRGGRAGVNVRAHDGIERFWRGSRGIGAAGRGSALPARYAAVHGRSARARRALRRLHPLRLRARHDQRHRQLRGCRRAGCRRRLHRRRPRTSSRSPTAGPPVDTPEEMRRPVLATDKRALHRRAGRGRRRRDARAGGRRLRARRGRLRAARRARRHDQGARRRRAEAVRDAATSPPPAPTGEDALADAEVRTGARFVNQRLAAVPMEPSAALAVPDPETGGFILYTPSQGPHAYQGAIVASTGHRRRSSCGSSRPPPAAVSARASRATPSRSSSSRSPASSARPCATSRRARRR